MRGKINKTTVEDLKPRQFLADIEVRGFCCRCLPSGARWYGLRYTDAARRQRWVSIGQHGNVTAEQARKKAKALAGAVAEDRDPVLEKAEQREEAIHEATTTVRFVLDEYLRRYVEKKKLRSARELRRTYDKYVRKDLGKLSIYDLKRRHIVALLDRIEDEHGPVMADRTLQRLRAALNWWAVGDDDFAPPFVARMAKTSDAERARTRKLSDEEIVDLWKALDAPGTFPIEENGTRDCYPRLIRVLLLTAARRNEAANATWGEIEGDIWVIPPERADGNQGHKTADRVGEKVIPLTPQVQALLGRAGKPKRFIFSTTKGKLPFSGFSKAKRQLDKAMKAARKGDGRKPVPQWTVHDLRRTARSLMSRAGVLPDHAERVLGHKIVGVRGTYDRHEFLDEKRDALERLARLVASIVNSPVGDNVIELQRQARG